jgi:tRNA-dihydrouridine synthase
MSVPYLLAPMASLSHRALRELIHRFGRCDEYYTEMISAAALLTGGPLEKYYLDAEPAPSSTVYQLVGSDADLLVRAAALLDKRDCAGVDINMGCSAPEIVHDGAGAFWLRDADLAARMISRVRGVLARRLSVKLRTGWEDDFDALVVFCKALESAGVDSITLHPRTAREKLKRRARWEYVGRLRAELGIPVAGNGDIATPADLVRRSGGPCDGAMVGRSAVRHPWIFAEARALESETPSEETPPAAAAAPSQAGASGISGVPVDLLETALLFLDLLAIHQPAEFFESRAKKFFAYFCDNLKWAHHTKTLLGREKDQSGMSAVLIRYFGEHPGDRYYIPMAFLKPATT